MKKKRTSVLALLASFMLLTVLTISCKNEGKKAVPENQVKTSENSDLVAQNTNENFEGVIYYEYDMGKLKYKGKYLIQGDRVRIEMEIGRPVILFTEENKSVVLMEGNKYMEMDYEKLFTKKPSEGDKDKMKIEQTGKTKSIAGHECEIWEVSFEGNETVSTLCMAKGLGGMMLKAGPLGKIMAANSDSEIFKEDYMPLESVLSYNGQTVSMKAVKIEEKDLEDSLFTIPENYTKVMSPMERMKQLKEQYKNSGK